MKLYHSLPPEARDSFVAKKLAPLLDSMPKERVKKGELVCLRAPQYLF
jgi:hypothetical protein